MNEDNYVLDEQDFYFLNDICNGFIKSNAKYINAEYIKKKFTNIWEKINKLNDLAKEKKETEKIGLLGKDADAIVFSEYSIGKEFKEKGK